MRTFRAYGFIISFLLPIVAISTFSTHTFAHQTSRSLPTQTGANPSLQGEHAPAESKSPIRYNFYFYSNAANAYVSARLGSRIAPLEVEASSMGPWETFTKLYNADGSVSFLAANGYYVSARLAHTGVPLEAVAASIGPWEKFNVVYLDSQSPIEAFQAANGNYISARIGTPGTPLEAVATSIGPWEAFATF